MSTHRLKTGFCLIAATCLTATSILAAPLGDAPGRWTKEKANQWLEQTGWLVGCNFIPSNAINQLEMFQADTFDPAAIDRELGYAESLGFNSVRVFLHDLLWKQDPVGFLARLDKFVELADKHHIGVMFALFDSCWHPLSALGKQPEPIPFTHNPGWVQSPGREGLLHPQRYPHLKEYVLGVVGHFRNDRRVQVWDVWNEPDNLDGGAPARPGLEPDDKRGLVRAMIVQAFSWARQANPSQPLTSGVWLGTWDNLDAARPMERIQLENSDVVSFHNYSKTDMQRCVANLKRLGRPVLCTEFVARPNGSTFDPLLQLLKEEKVAAYCWGFVSGKTQTIYPWDSWTTKYTAEPPLWFHDILRRDGTPYRAEEVEFIRKVTGKVK